jgi:hypothetical protein
MASGLPYRPTRPAALLCVALLALTHAAAQAQSLEIEAGTRQSDAAAIPPGDLTLGAVIIEAEPISEPTVEELLRGFREALARDRTRNAGDIVERQLAGGILEVGTRYGRFCFTSMPSYLGPTFTSGVNLVSRCTTY